jgi:hypothetical protein
MNRSDYFNYIDEKLGTLAYRINARGKLNILDYHQHSENFYSYLINHLYNWETYNLNPHLQNVEAIDLIDTKNKFIVQVSATNSKKKLQDSLDKIDLVKYNNHRFKFISIAKESSKLKKGEFALPTSIVFTPNDDIIDNKSILNFILATDIDNQKAIYRLIKEELGNEVDSVKLDSNLATIINILSKEDWDTKESFSINPFEIERKISHNNLSSSKFVIEDFKIHHNRVDKKYSEFDKLGSNKSSSVLNSIRKEYVKLVNQKSDNELFLQVIENVILKIQNSANFVKIPIDELELCVNILVVDAFIRCKIFENPENYNYVTTLPPTS